MMFNLFTDRRGVLCARDSIIEDDRVKHVEPGEGILNNKLIFDRVDRNISIIMDVLAAI